jgi:hypothetical protein
MTIQFNPDGSGVIITSDGRTAFSAGITQVDLLSLVNKLTPPQPLETKLSSDTVAAIFQGAQRMTDVRQFGADYLAAVKTLIGDLENLRTLQDRVAQDSTLFDGYLASTGARTDLQKIDLTNASGAIVQLLFAFDSGAPTQKSQLFRLL